jgi:hypothetical protein
MESFSDIENDLSVAGLVGTSPAIEPVQVPNSAGSLRRPDRTRTDRQRGRWLARPRARSAFKAGVQDKNSRERRAARKARASHTAVSSSYQGDFTHVVLAHDVGRRFLYCRPEANESHSPAACRGGGRLGSKPSERTRAMCAQRGSQLNMMVRKSLSAGWRPSDCRPRRLK